MARIRNANPKSSSGGYERVFNDAMLGRLSQRVQSTVITNGNELEKILVSLADENNLLIPAGDLDAFVASPPMGTYLATKRMVKNSKYAVPHHQPDFIVFRLSETEKLCYIVELKDGNAFDTKKSSGEHDSLKRFQGKFGIETPFVARIYICSFNCEDVDVIIRGFKGEFDRNEVMTGRMFCDLLGLDYDGIVSKRQSDAPDNVDYYVDELLKVPAVVSRIAGKRRRHVNPDEFYSGVDE